MKRSKGKNRQKKVAAPTPPVEIKDSSYYIEKLKNTRAGMLKHHNEAVTVESIHKILRDRLVTKMRTPGTLMEVIDSCAELFVHDKQNDFDFARTCFRKAVRRFEFEPYQEREFYGLLTDALRRSSHIGTLDLRNFLLTFTPVGWKISAAHVVQPAAAAVAAR